jgi:hypothetical protein
VSISAVRRPDCPRARESLGLWPLAQLRPTPERRSRQAQRWADQATAERSPRHTDSARSRQHCYSTHHQLRAIDGPSRFGGLMASRSIKILNQHIAIKSPPHAWGRGPFIRSSLTVSGEHGAFAARQSLGCCHCHNAMCARNRARFNMRSRSSGGSVLARRAQAVAIVTARPAIACPKAKQHRVAVGRDIDELPQVAPGQGRPLVASPVFPTSRALRVRRGSMRAGWAALMKSLGLMAFRDFCRGADPRVGASGPRRVAVFSPRLAEGPKSGHCAPYRHTRTTR